MIWEFRTEGEAMTEAAATQGPRAVLDRVFGLSKAGTNLRIGLGFITYALCKLIAGKFADAKPAVLVLALIFAIKFAVG